MERKFMKGNEALAEAAVRAGCRFFAGYPITPQNEIPEYLSRRMPEVGGTFVQGESEVASTNMVIGSAYTGTRAMTSTSGPGLSLMCEGLSSLAGYGFPAVIMDVMRGGPGLGNIYPSQGDYFQATKGGGNGDYHLIVLAPSTVQECADLTYKAFYLAQKYRNPTVLLADGLLGQMMEPVEFKPYPYPEIDNSDWALSGAKNRSGRIIRSYAPLADDQCVYLNKLYEKYKLIEQNETEWEEKNTQDCYILLVSFGSTSRNVNTAAKICREKGIKAGTFRPITLYPFPSVRLNELADKVKKIICVEVNMGQMINDVRLAVNGKVPVELINKPVGMPPSPEDIAIKIEELI